jgi:hypothetical protein
MNVTMRAPNQGCTWRKWVSDAATEQDVSYRFVGLNTPLLVFRRAQASCETIPFSGGVDVSRIHERFFASTAMVRTLMSVSPGCARSNL